MFTFICNLYGIDVTRNWLVELKINSACLSIHKNIAEKMSDTSVRKTTGLPSILCQLENLFSLLIFKNLGEFFILIHFPLIYTFFFKKHTFKKHEAQNAKFLRNI